MSAEPTRHVFVAWKILGHTSTTVLEVCKALAELGHSVTLVARGVTPDEDFGPRLSVVGIEDAFPRSPGLSHILFLWRAAVYLGPRRYDFLNAMYSPGISLLLAVNAWKKATSVLHITTAALLPGLRGKLKNFVCRLEAPLFGHVTILDLGIAPNIFFGKRTTSRMIEFPLGVNPTHFSGNKARLPADLARRLENADTFIYLGKMDRTRCLHNLIEAFATVSQENPSSVLLMVGDGNDTTRLRNEAKRRGIEDSVIFTGMVPYNEVPNYLDASRIALSYIPMTRIYDFQPPLKTLEYLQAGIPQVATATAANKKVLSNEHNALVASDDPDEYACAVLRLANDPMLYTQIKSRCGDGIEPYYWTNLVSRILLPMYRNAVAR